MEILTEIKHIKYTAKNLRYFGYILSGFLLLLCISAFRKNIQPQMYLYFFSSLLLAATTWMNPLILKPLYKVWMMAALCIGMVVSFVFLTIIFMGAFCTTGMIGKIAGKQFLPLRKNGRVSSYWITKKSGEHKERYEKQY